MRNQVILTVEEVEEAVKEWLSNHHYQTYQSTILDVSVTSGHGVKVPEGGFRFDLTPV